MRCQGSMKRLKRRAGREVSADKSQDDIFEAFSEYGDIKNLRHGLKLC